MIGVSTALGDDVDRSSQALTDFGARIAGLNAELLHGIRKRKWQIVVLKIVLIVTAVQCERQIILTGSVHGEAPGGEGHLCAIAGAASHSGARLDSGYQEGQV